MLLVWLLPASQVPRLTAFKTQSETTAMMPLAMLLPIPHSPQAHACGAHMLRPLSGVDLQEDT